MSHLTRRSSLIPVVLIFTVSLTALVAPGSMNSFPRPVMATAGNGDASSPNTNRYQRQDAPLALLMPEPAPSKRIPQTLRPTTAVSSDQATGPATSRGSSTQSEPSDQPEVSLPAQDQDSISTQDGSGAKRNLRDPQPETAGKRAEQSKSRQQDNTPQMSQSCPTSPIAAPEQNDTTFVVDCGSGLDTGCTFRNGGPLVFNVKVNRFVGDVTKLKSNHLISETATLKMPAFDVDFFGGGQGVNPERDRVSFNGHVVPTEFLQGDNNVWRLNEFSVPIEWMNFPSDPGRGNSVTPADNIIRIDIDTANTDLVWCTAIDWAALKIEVVRPIVMVHGILSDGGAWNKPGFSWLNKLNGLGIPNNGTALSMGNLDSIGNNAAKIATEVAIAKQRWGVDKVNLVCHSKGGIDARHYVENTNSVERVIQLGTPNAGSPLADLAQGIIVGSIGIIPAILVNALAGPAGVQLTRPYMAAYNFSHGSNPKVKYIALAGDYDPDCFVLNPFCRPIERLLLAITGRGDTIVPISSVHALGYTEKRTLFSSGANKEATHTNLNASLGVYNRVRDRLEVFGMNAPETIAAEPPPIISTAAAIGSIQQGQVKQQTIPVDQATPTTFSLMYPSGNLDLALVSPSGQRFDATTVIGNPDVGREEAEIPGGMMEVYTFNAPEVGVWTVEISAPSVTEPSGEAAFAVNAWLENPVITFTGSLEKQSVHAGAPLRLLGTLQNSGTPLTGASVVAKIALPDNTARNVTLLDDGTGGDTTANDGIYMGTLSDTTQSGNYRISLVATRAAAPGAAAFSRTAYTMGTASRSQSTIAGPISDFGQDTDGDGFFNQLVVQIGVNATAAANYRLVGTLRDANGNTQDASVLAPLNAGQNTVSLSFDGETIFNNRVNGPYQLVSVRLAEENNLEVLQVDERTNAHQTAGYSFRQFEHNAINLTGSGSTEGIDTNANGRFEHLKVGIGIEVINSGSYNWSARLSDRNGTDLGFASNSGVLSAGSNTIFLTFDGEAIGRNGVDGPYFVRGLIVFGTGDSLVASDAFTTSALRANQFEGFTANADLLVTQSASPSPALTGSNITYTTTVTNNGPSPAESVVVTDNLPMNTTFVSCATTGGVCGGSGNNRSVSIPSIATSTSVTITLIARVDCSLADGAMLSNTATVSATTPDQVLVNNSATLTTTVNAAQGVQFNSPTFSTTEASIAATVTVIRPCNASGTITVDYATSDGTALQQSDYTIAVGKLIFAPGEVSKTITILVNEDAYVENDETVTLTLSNPTGGAIFGSPSTATLTITDNDTAPPTTNPIDEASNFVIQQYHDFLSRTPDAGGLAYWTDQITMCGADTACINRRRAEVSAAFFVEQEFQQTGFFIYRFGKASLGVRPTYKQFSRDRGALQIGPGLEASKEAFAEEFVQRPEFIAGYGASSSCPDYVDTLIANVNTGSGVNLVARRNDLINECNIYANAGPTQRARVVRKLIEYPEFMQAEYNPAFVLAEYFGYLRRDPDPGGYQFWLDVLNNRVPGNYRAMVCAFITSREYQERFSPVVARNNQECSAVGP